MSSTMMIVYKGEERVKVLCSKNEGKTKRSSVTGRIAWKP
jgi:hypothetical protein